MILLQTFSLGVKEMNHTTINNSCLKSKQLPKLDLIVQSGIIELDSLIGGLKAGEITYIDGNSQCIYNIPNQLCVHTYQTFKSDTIYIDGGICADPYKIAKYARSIEVDQHNVLDHVKISRAFTVYQLSTFIQDVLEEEIKKYNPRTIIIGRFPSLYLDPDVPEKESQVLLQNNLSKLHELTATYNLITVLTNKGNRRYNTKWRTTIQSMVHETIQMKYIQPCTYVDLLKRKDSTTILDMAQGQLRLDHFGVVS